MITVNLPMPKQPEPRGGAHRHVHVAKNWWAIEYVRGNEAWVPGRARFFCVDLGIVRLESRTVMAPKYGACGPRGGVRFKNAAQAKDWCARLDEHMAHVRAEAARNAGAA